MKRIIAILALLTYFSGIISIVGAEENTNEETQDVAVQDALLNDEKIETVFSLEIMTKNSDENMFLEGSVSRMDFAEYIFRIMNFENKDDSFEVTTQYFEDVSLHHYGAGYIQDLASKGIISGYDDKTFRPEKKITCEEAATIVLNAIGHGTHADLSGKSSYSYARDIGILEDIKITSNSELTRKEAAHMLYNMMYIKVPDSVFSATMVGRTDNGEEFIRSVMGVDYVDGVIDAIGGVSLYDNKISENVVSVNRIAYDTKNIFDDTHLGYNVRAYIDINNYDSLLCYITRKNEALELDSNYIIGYNSNIYSYRNESDNEKKARIEEDFDFVYNKYYSQDITKITPKYGKVKLIDNDRNGKYDVVIVTDMQSLEVDSVIGGDEIVFKNTDDANQNITINLKDYDTISIYNSEGNETKQSTIRSGSILTIIKNEKGVIDIYVSNKTISGKVTENGIDEKRYVIVDENKYELIDDCYCGAWNGTLGINVVLKLDMYDNVAGVECSFVSGWQYGYILKLYKLEDEFGERVQIKMLTERGTIEKLVLREKVSINATTVKTAENQYNVLNAAYNNFEKESQDEEATSYTKELATTHIIKYQVNEEGIITKLDTPVRRSIFANDKISSDANDSFMLRCKGNMYYEPRQKQLRAAYQNYIDLTGEIFVGSQTKVFVIPDEDNTNPEDEDYRVTALNGVGFNPNGQFVYASGYNSDNNSLVCDVVVLRFGTGTSSDSNMMIFKKSRDALYDNDEVRTRVSGYTKGNMVEYFLADRNQNVDVSNLKKGDVILYRLANDEMIIENIIYNTRNTGILNNSSAYTPLSTETYFNANFRVVKGTPVKTSDGFIHIDFEDENMLDEILSISSIDVYEESGEEQFYTSTPQNIKTTRTHGQYADTIFLCTKNGQNLSAIVVRK